VPQEKLLNNLCKKNKRRSWFVAGFLLSHHHFLKLFSALIPFFLVITLLASLRA